MAATLIGTATPGESVAALFVVTTTGPVVWDGQLLIGFGASWDSGTAQTHVVTGPGIAEGDPLAIVTNLRFSTGQQSLLTIATKVLTGTSTNARIVNRKTGASNSITAGNAVFDGIRRPFKVFTATATGTGTAATVSITPTMPCLVIGMVGYNDASPATFAPDSPWTQLFEADENNDAQAMNVAYQTGLTGAQTVAWTLSRSVDWGAIAIAIEEDPGRTSLYDATFPKQVLRRT